MVNWPSRCVFNSTLMLLNIMIEATATSGTTRGLIRPEWSLASNLWLRRKGVRAPDRLRSPPSHLDKLYQRNMSALDEDEKKLLALLKKKADSGKTAGSKDANKSHQKHAAKPAMTKVIQSGGPTGVPPGASYSTAAGGKLAEDPLLELTWDPKKDTHYRQWKSKMDMVDEATHSLTKSFNDLKMVGDIAAINKIVRKALTKKQNLAIPTSTSGRADFDRLKLRLEDILKVQLGDDAVVALREFAGPLRKYFDGLSVNSTLQAGAEQIYTHGQLVAHCKHRWAKARLRKIRTQFSEAEKSLREKLAKDLLNLRNR